MATTSPDNIWSPDAGDDYALTVDLAAMADTVQDALTSIRGGISYQVMTDAERQALSGADLFAGLSVYTTDTDLEYIYNGSAWRIRPGTLLASGKAAITTAVSGATLVIVETPVLPVGQEVIIGPTRLAASISGGGSITGTLRWINTGATVTSATGEFIAIRGYAGLSNVVTTLPPITTLFTTTAEQKVSAGLFFGAGTSYGADGQELTIVAA